MNLQEIQAHWSKWASDYGIGLRATTKSGTAKILEIDALDRRIKAFANGSNSLRILEVGCGNGINCVELAKANPGMTFHGVDYIQEMVDAAEENAAAANLSNRLTFWRGDVLGLANAEGLSAQYDIVFTDRCLINLNEHRLQTEAISVLAGKVRPGGQLLMIENSQQTYDRQNECRVAVGLEERTPAEFNLFFDERIVADHVRTIPLELRDVEDFISLHDLVLYVLVPAVNGGSVDYDHPMVIAATQLSKQMNAKTPSPFGQFGQNRLFVCQKPL